MMSKNSDINTVTKIIKLFLNFQFLPDLDFPKFDKTVFIIDTEIYELVMHKARFPFGANKR